jgi:hypothetical protein
MELDAKQICLSSVEIRNDNTFVYHYEAGKYLSRFLSGKPLWVRYEESIKDIPPGIAAIPFAGIMSPLMWFFDGSLDMPVLDKKYAESLDNVKTVYQAMYPQIPLSGRINIGTKTTATQCDYPRKAALFTGGIDSTATVLRHLEENPLLISIWGSEAKVHQEKAWQQVNLAQTEAAKELGLQRTTIVANHLEVLRQWEIDLYFPGILQRSWYVEVAYGPIFLGLTAPITWRESIGTVYIAGSYTAETGPPDGSNPALINNTAWTGTNAVYDGGDEERQTKMERIIAAVRTSFPGLKFNVCTLGKDEGNCSVCEKCSRAIVGLALMGIDPTKHGFVITADTPVKIRQAMEKNEWPESYAWRLSRVKYWREMQERMPNYRDSALPQWREFFDWFSRFDVNRFIREPSRPLREAIKRLLKRWLPPPLHIAIRRGKRILREL